MKMLTAIAASSALLLSAHLTFAQGPFLQIPRTQEDANQTSKNSPQPPPAAASHSSQLQWGATKIPEGEWAKSVWLSAI